MSSSADESVLRAAAAGDPAAFEQLYHTYSERLRMAAWRMCRRREWIDDLTNETWRRGFEVRTSFDPARPFLLWLIGILRNVFREHLRQQPINLAPGGRSAVFDPIDPARVAAEVELLVALNACVAALSIEDREIVHYRFFQGETLRAVSERLRIPESTLRETRIPDICTRLRKSLKARGIEISEFFSAQEGDASQYLHGE